MSKPNITLLSNQVREFCERDATGHDWWHVHRVVQLSLYLAKVENADMCIVEPAALVHDVDDWKVSAIPNNYKNTRQMLEKSGYTKVQIEQIIAVVSEVSFKGAGVNTLPSSIEAMVVQDADRLDAIGAIGIARAFAFGGAKNRSIYNPDELPTLHKSFEDYKNGRSHTINHFYEKLLLLSERMNTPTAKILADERHRFMETFLEQFYKEWELRL